MAKQEEIRGGVAEKIFEWCKRNGYIVASFEWKEACGATRGMILAITDIVLEYEDSQGVVVKVDRELPTHLCECCEHYDEKAGEDFCFEGYCGDYGGDVYRKWKFAGYVAVEPLVEEA